MTTSFHSELRAMTHHTTRSTLLLASAIVAGCALGGGALAGCTVERDPLPATDAGRDAQVRDAGTPDDAGDDTDAGPPPECTPEGMGATIGEACERDADCDDACFCNGVELCQSGECVAGNDPCGGSECAVATCTEAGGCSLAGDDSMCDDGEPCNGAERCDVRLGCRAGAPPSCNDADICTIDACEPGVGCVYEPFDGDGDGEASRTCGGSDCNDRLASIGPHAAEICDNGIDDDCDGAIDIEQEGCRPTNDTCASAEDITPTGLGTFRFRRTTVGFANDTTLACTVSTTDTRRAGPDAVFVLRLTEARDVTLQVEGLQYNAGIVLRELAACAEGPDLKCSAPSSSSVEPVLRRRNLPAGEYAIFVKTRAAAAFTLAVTLAETSGVQADICADDVLDISAGGSFAGGIEDHDYELSCHTSTISAYPEAAFRIVVPTGEFRDVRLLGTVRTPTGSTSTPYLELTSACGDDEAALSECISGSSSTGGELLLRGLPEGTYYVLLEGSYTTAGVGSYTLEAEVLPSAGREPGDSCDPGVPVVVTESTPGTVDLASLDAVRDEGEFCGANRAGYRDAFFTFTLAEERDVLVRTSSTARHWVGLSSECGEVASGVDCAASASGVAERRFLRVPAGTHYLDVSTLADSGTLTAEITTFAPTPRPGNDLCAGATPLVDGAVTDVPLPEYSDDVDYSCGGTEALDAYYTFTLATPRFVVLRAEGASSMAILSAGCDAPPAICDNGGPPEVSQVFEAGTYHVAVETPALTALPVRLRFTTADP